jgi:hypothetical protein
VVSKNWVKLIASKNGIIAAAAIALGVLVGAITYGVLHASTAPTAVDHRPAARAQVKAMLGITESTYTSFESARAACGTKIVCLYDAANTALQSQSRAAAMVDLSLYTGNAQNIALNNFLTPIEALEKAYLKASQTISLSAYNADLSGITSDFAQAKYYANVTLTSLR